MSGLTNGVVCPIRLRGLEEGYGREAANGNGGDIQAEYIEDRLAVGKGTYDPNGPVGDPLLAVPVLYK